MSSCLPTVMMVYSAQLAEGGGARPTLSLYLHPPWELYVALSTLTPSKSYLYSIAHLLYPSEPIVRKHFTPKKGLEKGLRRC